MPRRGPLRRRTPRPRHHRRSGNDLHAGQTAASNCAEAGHFIADNATVIGTVILESESSVWFNTVDPRRQRHITIGERSNIQDGSVLHTDEGIPLSIGPGVTVGHLAMLHGCTIGEGVARSGSRPSFSTARSSDASA